MARRELQRGVRSQPRSVLQRRIQVGQNEFLAGVRVLSDSRSTRTTSLRSALLNHWVIFNAVSSGESPVDRFDAVGRFS